MINERLILNFNIKHQIYLFYLTPLFFLIGRASIDLVITYIGLNFFIYRILFEKDYSIIKNKIFQISLFFCCVLILISFFSSNFNISIFKSVSYLRFILFFGATTYLIRSHYFKLNHFYYVIGVCLIFINIDILVQYLFGYDLFGYEAVKSGVNSFRYSGFFGNEFVAGNYILKFTLIFTIITILKSKELYKKYISEFFIILSIIIILITGERMAFISVLYSFFFIFIFISKIRYYSLVIGILIITLVGGIIIFDKGVSDRITSIPQQLLFKKNDEYHNPHLNLFKQSIEIFKNNKVFGTGIKTFREACNLNENLITLSHDGSKINYCSNHPHNYYFEFLSETGLLGFLAFLLLVFSLLYFSGFTKEYSNNQKLSFLCLLVFLFPISTTGSFFTNINGCYFWFLISLININLVDEKT